MTNVIPIDVARARKIAAEAALTEMELAKARREYVAIEEVEKVWTDLLGAVRAKLLVMPNTLAAILAPETETKVCQQIIENNVHEVLTELASYNPKEPKPGGQAKSGKSSATSKAHRKPVGRPRKTTKLRE